MKTLFTWSGLKEFRHEGSVSKGLTFHTGVGFAHPYRLNAAQLHQILTEFSERGVKVGTHRTAPPDGSIGDWIKGRFKLGGSCPTSAWFWLKRAMRGDAPSGIGSGSTNIQPLGSTTGGNITNKSFVDPSDPERSEEGKRRAV
jgi:hypothetical protein